VSGGPSVKEENAVTILSETDAAERGFVEPKPDGGDEPPPAAVAAVQDGGDQPAAVEVPEVAEARP
jgi:hypothetical protein